MNSQIFKENFGGGGAERETHLYICLLIEYLPPSKIGSTRMLKHVFAQALESQVFLHKVFSTIFNLFLLSLQL